MREVGDPRHHTVPELPWKRDMVTVEQDGDYYIVRLYRSNPAGPTSYRFSKAEAYDLLTSLYGYMEEELVGIAQWIALHEDLATLHMRDKDG